MCDELTRSDRCHAELYIGAATHLLGLGRFIIILMAVLVRVPTRSGVSLGPSGMELEESPSPTFQGSGVYFCLLCLPNSITLCKQQINCVRPHTPRIRLRFPEANSPIHHFSADRERKASEDDWCTNTFSPLSLRLDTYRLSLQTSWKFSILFPVPKPYFTCLLDSTHITYISTSTTRLSLSLLHSPLQQRFSLFLSLS